MSTKCWVKTQPTVLDLVQENAVQSRRSGTEGRMMPREQGRTARIEARIAPDALAVVKRAAEIQGRSVSDLWSPLAQEARNGPSRKRI